ncbi:hypothetical protein [Variovorax sp. KK3]|uniref:hypothetical protein n=1 Tax=Variovorax sp. KK3 TaxID=1855728 RepID=UPI00097BD1FD|nr:hypothetical protein [Variovorax sp. KK3]
MNKLLICSLLAIAAGHAMAQNSDASEQRAPVLDSKPQLAADAARQSRPMGQVRAAGGDELTSAVNDNIGADRAGQRGEQLARTRDQRHPGHAPSTQGGTPDSPGAK